MGNHGSRIASIVVLGALGLCASMAKADFTLWNDEQLTVDQPHSLGMLFDHSQAYVVSGGSVNNTLSANDASTVNISGGSVSYLSSRHSSIVNISGGSVGNIFAPSYTMSLDARDTSTVNISGGSVNNTLSAYARTSVDISGGSVGSLFAYNSSTVNISGGAVNNTLSTNDDAIVDISGGSAGYLYTHNASILNILGGAMGSLHANDASTVNISGGSIGSIFATSTSTANISGGTMSSILAYDTSTVTFLVRGFRLGEGLSLTGGRILGLGYLSGEWLDGTRWTSSIGKNATGATIRAITPLPGDANHDGLVDVGDLGILGANYGATSGKNWLTGDFTGDGAVDVGDLGVLGAHYGAGVPAAVPEPATLGLLVLGLAWPLLRRRRNSRCAG